MNETPKFQKTVRPKAVVIDYKPREPFKLYHARTQRQAVIVAHRRAGKTVATIRDLERAALRCQLVRPRFGYIAPLYAQAKQVAWDYVKAGAYDLKQAGVPVKINESELRVTYHNGAELKLFGGDNPDMLRGLYFDGVVLDEVADMKPDLLDSVIRPALADRKGWLTLIGTPKGRDAFYNYWRRATTTESAEWFATMLKASETGFIDADELAKLREELSPSAYAREFECSFDEADISQFISGQEVSDAMAREPNRDGPKVLGVDVARFGDDRTVIVFRHGDTLEQISTFQGLDTMQVVGRVVTAITEFGPEAVFVDVGGLGAGVVDRLRQLRFAVFEVNAGSKASEDGKFVNLRAEMWWKMRVWLRERGHVPKSFPGLTDDLTSLTYSYDARNRIKLEKKEDLKSRGLPSPDIADALALTFAFPVAGSGNMGRRQARAGDYNPLDPYADRKQQAVSGMEWNPLIDG